MFYDQEPTPYILLNANSQALSEHKKIALEISQLAKGGPTLDPRDYLLIRDDENSQITKKRIEKFVDKNYLGSAIRLQRVRQSSGDLDVHTESLPGNTGKWGEFLGDADGRGNSFKEVIINAFEEALINKVSFLQVELPKLSLPPGANQAQLEEFLTFQGRVPYLVSVPLQNILSYEEDSSGVRWLKYKRVISRESPFSNTKYDLQFVLVDDQHITTWIFEDVKLSESGQPTHIYDPAYNNGKGGYRFFNAEKEYAVPESIEHSRGACPVLKFEIPESLWMASQTYRAQRVINGLLMNMLHTACNSGYVQKWARPFIQNSGTNASVGVGNAPIPPELQQEIVSAIAKNMGDESLLFLETFQFSELKGDSVVMQMSIIEDLKRYIFTSIAHNLATIESEAVNAQSGRSKEVDLYLLTLALKNHGVEIISFTRNVIKAVARAFGFKESALLNAITVSGMTRFDIRPVHEALDTCERILKLPKEAMPSEVLTEVIAQLAGALLENYSYESKSFIRQSITQKVNNYLSTPALPIS